MKMKMGNDRLKLIRAHYNPKPVSFMNIGKELLSDTHEVQTIVDAHSKLQTGLKVVGFGFLGLFAISQFNK